MPERPFSFKARSLRSLPAAVLSLALVGGWGGALFAAENSGKGPAYTQPPADDPNYELMGEFVGQIRAAGKGKSRQRLALQIRPQAGNRFEALAYQGGLPGQKQHAGEAMSLIGLRAGEQLVLSGGPWAIFVDPKGCNIVSSKGQLLGRLKRIERVSPTLGAQPPEGATVIFDGSGTDQFAEGAMTEAGLLEQGALIAPMFQDFDLHVEFRLPYMPRAEGQQRGNSGLYLQSRYECQVLDSFGTEPMINGLGALYRFKAPDVNMALPPLVWQTYDVRFTAPRWAADGSKIRDARVTSWVNGVKVQDDVALADKTGAGKQEAPSLLPIRLQDHGDPVRFRNLWIVDRGLSQAKFPVKSSKQQRRQAAKLEWNAEPQPNADAKSDEAGKADAEQADASAEKQAAESQAATSSQSKPKRGASPQDEASESAEGGKPVDGEAAK